MAPRELVDQMAETNSKDRGQKGGKARGDRERFPYEPRFVGRYSTSTLHGLIFK
jgi:hypothetical protein